MVIVGGAVATGCALLVAASMQVAAGVDKCSRLVPAYWERIPDAERIVLRNGLFAAPACDFSQVTELDLSSLGLQTISLEIVSFPSLVLLVTFVPLCSFFSSFR